MLHNCLTRLFFFLTRPNLPKALCFCLFDLLFTEPSAPQDESHTKVNRYYEHDYARQHIEVYSRDTACSHYSLHSTVLQQCRGQPLECLFCEFIAVIDSHRDGKTDPYPETTSKFGEGAVVKRRQRPDRSAEVKQLNGALHAEDDVVDG